VNELVLLTLNQAQQAPQTASGAAAGGFSIVPLILMFVIFYFFLIRPQKKRQREHQEMLARLKKGDAVVTAGGIVGSVFALSDTELVVEIADRVKVRVLRSQVNLYRVTTTEAAEGAEKEE
jgi:preprotein translocase subunit YajC